MATAVDPLTEGIAARVKVELKVSEETQGLDIQVVPDRNGVVVLRGSVPSEAAKKAAVRAAWRVQAVGGVRDELKVGGQR